MASVWDVGTQSEMVSIGTHKLFLSSSGPDRKTGEPVVLLMQGMGSTVAEWVAVRRLITPFARWVEYDRSGLGRSESPPEASEAISAASVAAELHTLLKAAEIGPPYIIVCHSWGGITSREFLHLRPNDVVGMIFVDANTEETYDGGNWPLPFITAVIGDQDWLESTGLARDQKLSEEDWDIVKSAQRDVRNQLTDIAEYHGYKRGDPAVLASKKQFETRPLGDRPIVVITADVEKDLQRIYDVGVAAGNGTEEDRSMFRDYILSCNERARTWQEKLLRLSGCGHCVTTSYGHNVQMMDPYLIAREAWWVWNHIEQLTLATL